MIQTLNHMLLEEMPQYRSSSTDFSDEDNAQRRLLRSLMNLRPPMPLNADFLCLQDQLLGAEREAKGVVHVAALPTCADSRLILWQGDITRLDADAIVNAANSELLGCFCPCHGCIDNAIHSAAGLQLRDACHRLMEAQGHPEPTGTAKITPAYNLPCRYVLHTVGPIVQDTVTTLQREQLASCYRACLALACQNDCHTVAFCCISTGEFRFPNELAARIAVQTVTEFLAQTASPLRIIFNVFKDEDLQIYRRILA